MNTQLLPLTNLWSIDTSIYRMPGLNISADIVKAVMAQQSSRTLATLRGSTAIIDVVGPIEKRPSLIGGVIGFTSSEGIRRGIQASLSDDSVDTILLRVDSPGGSVDGLAETSDAIFEARKSKTVIAQVDGMAASAALHMASQATRIFAGRTDLVGSIGTVLTIDDSSKMFAEAGIEVLQFKSGPMKGAGEDGTEVTQEQRDMFQGLVDAFFDDFLKTVARGRGMTVSEVKKSASGEVFLAPEAKARGLIDKIQTMDQTLAQLDARSAGRGRTRRARAGLELVSTGS